MEINSSKNVRVLSRLNRKLHFVVILEHSKNIPQCLCWVSEACLVQLSKTVLVKNHTLYEVRLKRVLESENSNIEH